MHLRKIAFAGWFCFICCASLAQLPASDRTKYNFNAGWLMMVGDTSAAPKDFDDHGWKKIGLPHAFNEDDAFKKSIYDLTTGIVWYRKHFRIDPAQQGKKIWLEFEGIRMAGEIFLNGKSIGIHENGVMAFGFDISDQIRLGEENVLAVRIDNSWGYREKATNSGFQWNDKNFYANYGGINKNVFLHISNKLYQTLPLFSSLGTTGVYIHADSFDMAKRTARVTAESQVKNEYSEAKKISYEVRIQDAITKKFIASFSSAPLTLQAGETQILHASAKLDSLHFWSWGYGYLYNVFTVLKSDGKILDVVKTVTGFRKTEFKDGMLRLNDRAIQLKGYAQRTTNEWPAIGTSVPAWLSDYSNGLMVESNANLVRWMHVTPWKQDIESCDRVGLIQAMPAGDSEGDPDGRRWEQRKELMRDAIIYNRNNPSIIFYESGNKGIRPAHMDDMLAIRNQYDPSGGRAIGSREMLASTTAEYGGEMLYINKSATKPLWQMEYSRDEGLRKYWDEFSPPYHKEGEGPKYKNEDASIYNHNQDAHAIENVVRWYDYYKERPGTGTRVNAGGVNIIFSESNTHFRGAENYRRSGEVDAMRIPKDGFYAHQAIWDGWVDIEKARTHLIGHWNYAAGTVKNIYVVSGAAKVELFLNGKSLGYGIPSCRFLYTFKNIAWQPGVLKAVGYDEQGKAICSDQHETTGAPYALRLTRIASPVALMANRADLALVEIEVVDAKGNRCPTALNQIHFSLDGPAEWRGGIAQGPDNFILSKDLPVECGVNRILVRTTDQAGMIQISASAEGLKNASIRFESKPMLVQNGLSLQLPADGLPSHLDRGATPDQPAYKVSRIALPIMKSRAGANEDKAALSYDDNETTDWTNDGKLNTAWIEYELGQQATISEINLKLNGFRTKSYPIRVSINGRQVFAGNTSKGLGYCNIAFAPVVGHTIKIEMTGSVASATDQSVEVNGKKLNDGVDHADSNAPGKFSIIEAEIYAHPAKK